jgi:hypothetical protein
VHLCHVGVITHAPTTSPTCWVRMLWETWALGYEVGGVFGLASSPLEQHSLICAQHSLLGAQHSLLGVAGAASFVGCLS